MSELPAHATRPPYGGNDEQRSARRGAFVLGVVLTVISGWLLLLQIAVNRLVDSGGTVSDAQQEIRGLQERQQELTRRINALEEKLELRELFRRREQSAEPGDDSVLVAARRKR